MSGRMWGWEAEGRGGVAKGRPGTGHGKARRMRMRELWEGQTARERPGSMENGLRRPFKEPHKALQSATQTGI